MASILVPGVAQATIQGTIAGNPWACVWHFQFAGSTADWSGTDVQTLADDVFNGWESELKPLMCNNVTCDAVTTVDLGTETPAVGSSTGTAWVGTISQPSLTAAACVLISMRIAARYKGGHPRTYLPGVHAVASTDGETITPGYQGLYATHTADLISTINSNPAYGPSEGPDHVAVRYTYDYTADPAHHKYLRVRTGVQGTYVIASYTTHPRIASQRRRLQT